MYSSGLIKTSKNLTGRQTHIQCSLKDAHDQSMVQLPNNSQKTGRQPRGLFLQRQWYKKKSCSGILFEHFEKLKSPKKVWTEQIFDTEAMGARYRPSFQTLLSTLRWGAQASPTAAGQRRSKGPARRSGLTVPQTWAHVLRTQHNCSAICRDFKRSPKPAFFAKDPPAALYQDVGYEVGSAGRPGLK